MHTSDDPQPDYREQAWAFTCANFAEDGYTDEEPPSGREQFDAGYDAGYDAALAFIQSARGKPLTSL